MGEYGCGLLNVLFGHGGENKGVGEALNERWEGAGRCMWSLQCDDQTELGMLCMLFDMVLLEKDNERRNRQRRECAGNRGSGRQKGRG